MQDSSEGETRGVGWTRPAGEAKERVMEEKVSTKANEEDSAKENSKRRRRERRSGTEWRQTWRPVAHTSRPRWIQEKERWRKRKKPEG